MALPLLLPNSHRHPRFCDVPARLIPKPTSYLHIFFLPNYLNRSTLLRLSALPDDVPDLFEDDVPGLFENFPSFDNVPGLFENFPSFDNVPGLFENFPRFDNVPGLFENFPRFDNVPGLFENFPRLDNVPGLFENSPRLDDVPGLFDNSPRLDDVPNLLENSPRLDDVPGLLENSPRLDDVPRLLENSPRLDDVPGLLENSQNLDEVPGLLENSPRLDNVPGLFENSPHLDDVPGLFDNSPRLDDVPKLLENSPSLDDVPGLLENSPRLDDVPSFLENYPRLDDVPSLLENFPRLDKALSNFPFLKSGIVPLLRASESFSESQRWGLVVFMGLAWVYLTARPGVLLGAIDAYLLDPLQKVVDGISGRRRLKMRDFVLGDKLGEGSFGVVYFGAIVSKDFNQDEERSQRRGKAKRRLSSDERFKERVILKKVKVGVKGAEECGEYEEWFNYRLSRAAPETCAEFLGSFIADRTEVEFTKGGKWLVWKFEGDQDLGDYIRERSFPRNLESLMFGRILEGVESLKRNALIIKQVMRQLISSLKKIHDTGIVHRDVKPSNLVVTKKGRIKLIDFGAATDLRIGKNYVPDRTLFDPDYCPPELYVLPEETPSPPPEPIAALLSPIIWQLNCPDLFDMYSAGIVLLQMAIPSLRSAAGLRNFNSEIKAFGYDLNEWKERTRRLPDLAILELDSGRGWDLATKLVSQRGGSLGGGRLSAAAALGHPYFLLGADQAAAVLSKFSFTK